MTADPFSLVGRTAIVTGAGNGIGRAVAVAFANAGAHVGCVDRDAAAAEQTATAITASGGQAIAAPCDVARESEVHAAVGLVTAGLGNIRVLLNAAAADDPTGTILDLDLETWNRIFAVNVTGAYLMSRAVLPAMIAAGGGCIIHVASQLGRVGAPGRSAYCATKGALIQLARAMAADHAGQNIRVNTLSPGAVETRRLVLRYGDMESARRLSAPRHLMERLGRPEEIARAALFLASDAASFMTGADLLVDGGYTAV